MKKYMINYDDGAKSDILNIIDYIEKKYEDGYNATRVATRIIRKCEALTYFPKSFLVHHEWSSKRELRAVHVKGYTIIYYVDDDKSAVSVVAVINSRRDIGSMLKGK